MGMMYHCPMAEKRTADGMILCRDGKLCEKQQYCQSKRTYENTPGIGSCPKRKEMESASAIPEQAGKRAP